LWCCFV
jgi:hypothetical protein